MSSSDRRRAEQIRTYDRTNSVVFLKTDEPFGGLSNMAGGFPLWVNGVRIRTSEALYQACRFPHRPEVQALIIEQKSPMTAKMKSKPYRRDSRPDWDQVRVKIMRWCLRLKLAQNWDALSKLLLETGERPIVEESRKDTFWGAKATDDGTLVGMNVLGRLLMELREAVRVEGRESLVSVQPLAIPDFLMVGRPIGTVTSQVPERDVESSKDAMAPARGQAQRPTVEQASLFDAPAVKEEPPAAHAVVDPKGMHVADLKPYAEYKESGLPWLGSVPTHWGLIPNRGLVRRRKVLVGKHHSEYRLLSLTKQGVIIRDISTGKGKFSSDMGTSQEVRSGDLVFCLFDVPETPRTVGLSRHDGMITGAYTVFESLGRGSSEYIELFYRAMDDRKLLSPLYSGLRNTIPAERLLGTKTPQPPPDEQAAIVRFLEWANGRMERAIRAKRKVIALLNEQKKAIIHRAVTRGLDPSVPLKPSGIPWLGDIPQHWEVRRMKSLSLVKRGASPRPIADMRYFDEGGEYAWVRIKDVTASNRYLETTTERLSDLGKSRSVPLEPGAIFLSIAGSVGKPIISKIKCCIHDGFVYFPHFKGNAEFLLYVFSSGRVYDGLGKLGTQLNLNTETVGSIRVPWPDVTEQGRIVTHLDRELKTFEVAISRLEREIELLREYRTRVVADVVTGKLDVREVAARLPDDVPLDLVEDDADLVDETETADEEAAV